MCTLNVYIHVINNLMNESLISEIGHKKPLEIVNF